MHTTREICKACYRVNPIGFAVPDNVWSRATPQTVRDGVLCIMCFARFADEARVQWDEMIDFFPVSMVTTMSAEYQSCEQARIARHQSSNILGGAVILHNPKVFKECIKRIKRQGRENERQNHGEWIETIKIVDGKPARYFKYKVPI
jgi:hypothetical protein